MVAIIDPAQFPAVGMSALCPHEHSSVTQLPSLALSGLSHWSTLKVARFAMGTMYHACQGEKMRDVA